MIPKIIILTGTDGTGKTTIKKLVEKLSKYKFIVIDRFTDSIIYDKIYRPNESSMREDMFYKLEDDLKKIANVLLVYLDCNHVEQLQRMKIKGESKEIIESVNFAKTLFEEYLSKTSFRTLSVDTSGMEAKEVAKIILEEF